MGGIACRSKLIAMNLAEYSLLYGDAGLRQLAADCATKVSYLKQLIYQPTVKEPSLSMAVALCVSSGHRLTCGELCRKGPLERRVPRRPAKVGR